MIKVKNDIGFNALCKKSVENNKSKYKNNDFWQWNMLENVGQFNVFICSYHLQEEIDHLNLIIFHDLDQVIQLKKEK